MTQNEDLTEPITNVLKLLDFLESQKIILWDVLRLRFELGKVRTDLKRLRDSLRPEEVTNDK